MGSNWGLGRTTSVRNSDRIESDTAASMTLIADNADTGYPALEYTEGQIIYISTEDVHIVEYAPDTTGDPLPVDVRNWALILADDAGTVLVSGVIRHAETSINDIRRYHFTPGEDGPAPPTHSWP